MTSTAVASGRVGVEPAIYTPARSSRGLWRDAWRRLLRNRLAVAGMILIGLVILIAMLADVLPLPDPTYQFPASSYARPSAAHLLGNDQVGRDVLSRLVHGARVSLSVAVFAQAINSLIFHAAVQKGIKLRVGEVVKRGFRGGIAPAQDVQVGQILDDVTHNLIDLHRIEGQRPQIAPGMLLQIDIERCIRLI